MEASSLKLLAIEANKANLTTLKAVLRDALPECALVTALDVPQGIDLARTEDPDVIMLDIVMPGMDGYEVCRQFKTDERLRSIPVVFLTALQTDRENRLKALEAGAEAFVSTPLDEPELVAQVRAMAKIKAANRLQRLGKEHLADLVAERTRALSGELAERKRAEAALRETVAELQKAVAQIKTLRGIVPICASCKKIRDGQGYWNQVEVYVRDHSEAEFSHGICPDCMQTHYPNLAPAGRSTPENEGGATDLRRQAEAVSREQPGLPPESLNVLSPEKTLRMLHELRVHQIMLDMQNKELRRAQLEQEASQARYFDLYELAPVGYCTLSETGLILEANLTAASLLGVAREELVKQPITRFILAEEQNSYYQHRKKLFETGGLQACELRMLGHDGTPFWARLEATAAWDAVGAPVGRVVLSDITERKRAETALQASLSLTLHRESETRELLAAARAAIDCHTFTEAVRRIFDACRKATGAVSGYVALLSESGAENDVVFLEAGGLPFNVDPSLPMPIRGLLAEAYHSSKVVCENDFMTSEWVHFMPSGHVEMRNVMFSPLVIDGKAAGVMGLANKPEDFTEDDVRIAMAFGDLAAIALRRAQTEEALRQSEERHRKIVEASTDAFLLRSGDVVIYANPAALKLFRAKHPEDLIGKRYLDLVHPDDRPLSAERVKKSINENWIAPPRELRVLALDGQVVHVESAGGPVKHRGEVQLFGVFRDITERKRAAQEKEKLEGQLRQAQKMEAIGTLAGGIAHDFNNILSVIVGTTELLNFRNVVDDPARTGLIQVLSACERARKLVSQILAFSRRGKQEKILIDLKPIVKETLTFLHASLPATIAMGSYLEPDAGTIMADPTQMQQILMNLCVNADHAMEKEGGSLQIKLSNTALSEEDTRFEPKVEPGDFVKLTVSDTGHGMEASVLERIFDPYFTTKEPGKGTGLGLSVVHGIVTSHGGMITVSSAIGKGTTFTVFLPRALGFEKLADTPLKPLAMGTETILFVDDEAVLADLGREILGELGYEVETKTSPIEAAEAFRVNPQKFDLVITDLTMPQMSGLKLSRRLMEIRPDIPIVLCTGFSEQTNEQAADALGIRAVLYKPLVMRDIADAVRKVLDDGGTL
jgi:PAS domain S-box-containing protein